MCREKDKQTTELYKNQFCISFYDETDEIFLMSFDNLKQICLYKYKEISSKKMTLIAVELYRALKRPDSSTRMLDGRLMHVYLVSVKDIEENE